MKSKPESADFVVQETLDDGSAVMIRAVRPDDKERIVKAFLALSPKSIYTRFLQPKKELSEEELRRLTEIDFVGAGKE